ncbi:MAG: hypothetical protein QOG55_1164 [Acidobacteriaceae bacterium]|jgi:hypothetical protein|nr:hypothetical protein [Acidobacteriaceae bacterium]
MDIAGLLRKEIDQANGLNLMPFTFESGSTLLCACLIIMVPTDSPLALVCS